MYAKRRLGHSRLHNVNVDQPDPLIRAGDLPAAFRHTARLKSGQIGPFGFAALAIGVVSPAWALRLAPAWLKWLMSVVSTIVVQRFTRSPSLSNSTAEYSANQRA
jgi:hypothetical protein